MDTRRVTRSRAAAMLQNPEENVPGPSHNYKRRRVEHSDVSPVEQYQPAADSMDRLNSDCLQALLSNLTTQEQIALRVVSPRWKEAIDYLLRHKKSLKLFGSIDDVSEYLETLMNTALYEQEHLRLKTGKQSDDLVVNWARIDVSTCYKLRKLFPKLEQLAIRGSVADYAGNIPNFISLCCSKVTSLSLFGNITTKQSAKFWNRIIRSIDKLPLQRLDLLLPNDYIPNIKIEPIFLRIPQLTTFYDCRLKYHSAIFLPFNNDLNVQFFQNVIVAKPNIESPLSLLLHPNITALTLDITNPNRFAQFHESRIVDKFKNLKYFCISYHHLSFEWSDISSFSKMSNLETLVIKETRFRTTESCYDKPDTLPKFNSVKNLQLIGIEFVHTTETRLFDYTNPPVDKFTRGLATMFPQLEQLVVRSYVLDPDYCEGSPFTQHLHRFTHLRDHRFINHLNWKSQYFDKFLGRHKNFEGELLKSEVCYIQ